MRSAHAERALWARGSDIERRRKDRINRSFTRRKPHVQGGILDTINNGIQTVFLGLLGIIEDFEIFGALPHNGFGADLRGAIITPFSGWK